MNRPFLRSLLVVFLTLIVVSSAMLVYADQPVDQMSVVQQDTNIINEKFIDEEVKKEEPECTLKSEEQIDVAFN